MERKRLDYWSLVNQYFDTERDETYQDTYRQVTVILFVLIKNQIYLLLYKSQDYKQCPHIHLSYKQKLQLYYVYTNTNKIYYFY